MNINIEYRHESGFSKFFEKVRGKCVELMYDVNTKPYALALRAELIANGTTVVDVYFEDKELLPTEDKCAYAQTLAENADYVMAVGSGTLNDMAKAVATKRGVPSGVLPTAASMDGYCSKGAALMCGGFKVTDEVHMPEDVLIDREIICSAPTIMTAAGFGDIIGKYTCLADWEMSNAVNGEDIHAKAYEMMQKARTECMDAFDGLTKSEKSAVEKLTNALITAGLSMAICGNSRPASGSEHHQSHFLEMDFARRGETIPPHGLKVAIGTLVSLELYQYIKANKIVFTGAERVYEIAEKLPSVESIKEMLVKIGCPVRFSALGVRKEVMEEMIEKAYTVRDRYTILTLVHDLGLTEKVKPILMEKYY